MHLPNVVTKLLGGLSAPFLAPFTDQDSALREDGPRNGNWGSSNSNSGGQSSYRGSDQNGWNMNGISTNDRDRGVGHPFFPLYTWDYSGTKVKETRFFSVTAHWRYVESLGHPWCFEGFGDAFTMAVTQLFKSEVSLMLSNAAAGLDPTRAELLWNKDDGAFIVANKTTAKIPGYAGDEIDGKQQDDDDQFYQGNGQSNGQSNRYNSFQTNALTSSARKGKDAGNQELSGQNSVTWPILMGLLNKIFDNSRFGQKLRSITDMLCQLSDAEAAAEVWADNVYFCFIEDLVGALLICGESEQTVECEETMNDYRHTKEDFPDVTCEFGTENALYSSFMPESFKFHDPDLSVPVLFVDLLRSTHDGMLPRHVPDNVIHEEALTYLVLFRALMIASSFSRKPFLCGADQVNPPVLIPGWTLKFVVTIRQEGDPMFIERGLKRDALPLVFISRSQISVCSFVVAVRGTASMFEWTADFAYWQVPFSLNPQVLAHSGFTNLINVLAPVVEDYIFQSVAESKCSCEETHLIFTGHSLGAGVGQMLALYFAEKYGYEKCGADIAGAFFAPPRMFNAEGSERFRRIVNGRTLLDIGDGLSYMPCYDGNAKSGWARCARGHMTTPGVGRDGYAENYGLVEIEVEYLNKTGGKGVDAVMQSIFPSGVKNKPSTIGKIISSFFQMSIPTLDRIPSLGVLGATHVCSFACRFSKQACGDAFQWWCDRCPMLI